MYPFSDLNQQLFSKFVLWHYLRFLEKEIEKDDYYICTMKSLNKLSNEEHEVLFNILHTERCEFQKVRDMLENL